MDEQEDGAGRQFFDVDQWRIDEQLIIWCIGDESTSSLLSM
jgi:hypothetical protein